MTAKEFLESIGFEFTDKDFWMEDYMTEHKFKDWVDIMERYAETKCLNDKSATITARVEELTREMEMRNNYYEDKIERMQAEGSDVSEVDESIKILREIKAEIKQKFESDPYIMRTVNMVIYEFEARTKRLQQHNVSGNAYCICEHERGYDSNGRCTSCHNTLEGSNRHYR